MAKTKTSKHTRTLEELGFKADSEILSPSQLHAIEERTIKVFGISQKNLSRAERRRQVSEGIVPYFAYFAGNDRTYVCDEKFVSWIAKGRIDLSSFGFADHTVAVPTALAKVKASLSS